MTAIRIIAVAAFAILGAANAASAAERTTSTPADLTHFERGRGSVPDDSI